MYYVLVKLSLFHCCMFRHSEYTCVFVLYYLAVVSLCVSGQKCSRSPQELCVTGLSRLNARRGLQSAAPPFFQQALYPFNRGSDRGGAEYSRVVCALNSVTKHQANSFCFLRGGGFLPVINTPSISCVLHTL